MREHLLRLRFPVLAYLLNRLAIFAFAIVSLTWIPGASSRWPVSPPNPLVAPWYRWDSEWYVRIAVNGYTNLPNGAGERDVVFLPGFPLAIRYMAKLTHDNFFAAGVIVSHVCLFLAVLIFYQLAYETHGVRTAKNALILLLCGPYAFFYSAIYTESLYLFLTVAGIYLAHRKQWLFSSMFIGLGGATRLVAVFAGVAVLVLYLQNAKWKLRNIRPNILFLALCGAGFLSYIRFLNNEFHDPLAFMAVSGVTGWSADATAARAIHMFLAPIVRGQFDAPYWLSIATLLVAAVYSAFTARKMGLAYALWTAILLVLYFRSWVSSGRYVSSHFPLFIMAGDALRTRRDLFTIVLVIFTLFQALALAAWTHGAWVC